MAKLYGASVSGQPMDRSGFIDNYFCLWRDTLPAYVLLGTPQAAAGHDDLDINLIESQLVIILRCRLHRSQCGGYQNENADDQN